MVEHLLLLLAASTPVGIRVIDTDDPGTADRVTEAVTRAVETRAQAIRLPNGAECREDEDCLSLRVFLGVTKHRIIIEYSSVGSAEPKKITRISLSADGDEWDETLARVIDRLIPRPPAEGTSAAALPPPPEPGLHLDSFWGPAMIIAGGALVIVASILAERSASARKQLYGGVPDTDEYASLRSRWSSMAIASVTLFSLGAVLAGGGIVLSFGW